MTTLAKLDGRPIALTSSPTWQMTTGVTPYIGTFDMATADALTVVRNGKPLKSKLQLGNDTWEALSVLYSVPGVRPGRETVYVADRRFWWSWEWKYRVYNLSRRTGFERRGEFQEKLKQTVTPIKGYARFSRQPRTGADWKPLDFLTEVIEDIDPTAALDIQFKGLLQVTPIQDVILDLDGASAIGEALAHVPGFDITVGPKGRIYVFSWLSGAEEKILGDGTFKIHGTAGAGEWSQGNAAAVDYANIVPALVRVLFTIESELRFDTADQFPAGSVAQFGPVPRVAANVAPIPDFVLGPQKLATGTFTGIGVLLKLWSDGQGLFPKGVAFKHLDRAMIPRNDTLWASFRLLNRIPPSKKNLVWAHRISTLKGWYRQGFQIPSQWMDNILELRDYLVATLDPVEGQRAPARAYGDWCSIPTKRGRWFRKTAKGLAWATNHKGFPGAGKNPNADTQPMPAHVRIYDGDQGVIRVDMTTSPWGDEQITLPGIISDVPVGDLRAGSGHVVFNAKTRLKKPVSLVRPQRMAIYLTAIPGNVLFSIAVDSQDKGVDLGGHLAQGPTRTVRVRPPEATARIRWLDDGPGARSNAKLIETVFGLRAGDPQAALQELARRGDIVNLGDNNIQAASLKRLALAKALQIFRREGNRYQGAKSVPLNSHWIPEGAIDTVTHTVRPDGTARTRLQTRATLPPLDIVAFFDNATQKIYLKLIK